MSKNVRKSETENSIANLPPLKSLKVREVMTVFEGVKHECLLFSLDISAGKMSKWFQIIFQDGEVLAFDQAMTAADVAVIPLPALQLSTQLHFNLTKKFGDPESASSGVRSMLHKVYIEKGNFIAYECLVIIKNKVPGFNVLAR